MRFFWVISVIGAVLGGLALVFSLVGASSGPQQTYGFVFAIGLAVIPYVLARAVEAFATEDWRKDVLAALASQESTTKRATENLYAELEAIRRQNEAIPVFKSAPAAE
ncbi:MAG TPA: hypothetical protein VFB13_17725 [Reyranella sp.]|nr:hypothetical protein [Reyranella sp.]